MRALVQNREATRGRSGTAPELGALVVRDDQTEVLQAAAASQRRERRRQSTYAGLPFGDAEFAAEMMDRRAGHALHDKPPGPVPKPDRTAAATG